jgi:uncharacterized protein (TIGR02118 family)
MVSILALHKRPDDPEAYERYYLDVHMPLVQRIPGVRNIRWGKVARTADDSPPPYYLVSDVYFDDMGALEAALASPEMAEALDDVEKFVAPGALTIMFCESQDVAPTG